MEIIEAITRAILKGQKEYEGVKLPTPQRAGTMTQCVTYARIKAQEIYEKHFQNK